MKRLEVDVGSNPKCGAVFVVLVDVGSVSARVGVGIQPAVSEFCRTKVRVNFVGSVEGVVVTQKLIHKRACRCGLVSLDIRVYSRKFDQ